MPLKVQTSTPPGTMIPIGPYNHIAKAGPFIFIGATAGVDPATGKLIGPDIASQTRQIIAAFETMLASVGAELADVLHINVFLSDMTSFAEMNSAYATAMGGLRPARTAIQVAALPKPGAVVTMNLTAIATKT